MDTVAKPFMRLRIFLRADNVATIEEGPIHRTGPLKLPDGVPEVWPVRLNGLYVRLGG